jgi:hypothetical protein
VTIVQRNATNRQETRAFPPAWKSSVLSLLKGAVLAYLREKSPRDLRTLSHEFLVRSGRRYLIFKAGQYSVTIFVRIDEDGCIRTRLVEVFAPDDYGLTELERELLDGLAGIIARDVLRRRRGIA